MKSIKEHIIYILIITLIVSLINLLIYFLNKGSLPDVLTAIEFIGWSVYFTVGLYLVNVPVSKWVQRNFPGFDLKNIVLKLLLGTIGSAVVSLIFGSLLYFMMMLWYGIPGEELLKQYFTAQTQENIQLIIWFSVTVAAVFHTAALIQNHQTGQLEVQQQKVSRISTRHESLKSQISSHFLFNSLNVLTGLIEENQDKAQEFVADLSSVYRYVLEQKDKEWVSIREEIDFCRTYMELIQKRFEDGLFFEIEGDFKEDDIIAPLTLQILIENCIKHNRISSEETLHIKVYTKDNYLLVKNNLQHKKQLNPTTGKGLKHILSRYKGFENKVEILQQNGEFTVKIPLITKNHSIMEAHKNYTEEEYRQAKERVEELQGFYWNLASYIIINAFLAFLDIREDGHYNWAFWPLIGWGIGVTFHAINVFGIFNSSDWKNRMIQKELDKRKQERDLFDSNH
ncbi:MAG: 2TM domain-containing protein [Weeksellaceae bacterium]|nr:2TM domain-containing protein [Weeksellaceae bacterium]